jgi:hypothetical protein
LRMLKMGLTPAQISAILDLPIAEVEATIAATAATIAQAAQEQN